MPSFKTIDHFQSMWYGEDTIMDLLVFLCILWGSWSCLYLKEHLTFIKQKVAIHCGSDYKGSVVVPASYQTDFEARGSISIISNDKFTFCIKNRTPISCVSFLVIFWLTFLVMTVVLHVCYNYMMLCWIPYNFMINSVGLLVHFVEEGALPETKTFC